MRKYTAVQGDYWDGIAKKIYGDESYMNTLLLANPSLTGLTVFDGGGNGAGPGRRHQINGH